MKLMKFNENFDISALIIQFNFFKRKIIGNIEVKKFNERPNPVFVLKKEAINL